MRSILKEYVRQNSTLVIWSTIVSLIALAAEPFFLKVMNSIEQTGITLHILFSFFLYIGLRMLNGYRQHILEYEIENSFCSFLRKRVVWNLTREYRSLEGNELLINKVVPEIASFLIVTVNMIFSLVSMLSINMVLLLEEEWMAFILFSFCFLILVMSSIITRRFGEKYHNYIERASESIDFQHNMLQNAHIVQSEDADNYILSILSKKMSDERVELEVMMKYRVFTERLNEASYIISNVLFPTLSIIIVVLELEPPFFLLQMIIISPHLTSMTNSIASFILDYRGNAAVIGSFIAKCKEETTKTHLVVMNNLDYAEDINTLHIQMSGTIPHVGRKVHFSVRGVGLYGIVGRSGSGKTTILHILAQELRDCNASHAVAFFDTRSFFLVNNTIENLSIYLGKSKELTLSCLREYCADFGVDISVYLRPPGEHYINLSEGQQKLLMLFAALHSNASILLLDEPTANLDALSRNKATFFIRRLSQEKVIIVSTHDPELYEAVDTVICKL